MTTDCGDSATDNALETSSVRTSSSATPSIPRGRSGKPCFSIAMNQVETLLISSAGDVLACHCRRAPHHPLPRRQPQLSCQDEMAVACCEPDDLSLPAQDAALCMWTSPERKGGLMGGNPAEVASPLGRSHHHNHHHNPTPPLHPRPATSSPSLSVRAHEAFRSPPINNVVQDEGSIVPIKSFDYSHFQDGGNDMVPEHLSRSKPRTPTTPRRTQSPPVSAEPVRFFHGIPTFVPAFSSVRMAQVSAHPDGAHVLCISEAGLLYSYGLNPYGQLGIGITSSTYLATPTIVTPLVEHGGKAIACAAGVDHSLVVVRTEERRLYKSQSHPSLLDKTNQHLIHHQVYGFGRNDYMKLGLVSPKVKDEIVPLPRRVALHAQIPADSLVGGIVSVAASAEHSAALVQRPSGAVEVYTWGNATHGALGLPKPLSGLDSPESPVQVVPVPSFCAALSSSPQKTASFLRRGEEPTQISLGPYTTHVVTNKGRLFSCGKSNSGVLGAGPNVTECSAPHEVELPSPVVCIRAGREHAVATTSNGRAWVWGTASYCGATTDNKDGILWLPTPLELPDVLEAAAGYDNTVLVQRNGSVWSCGKASGRLGLGETSSATDRPSPASKVEQENVDNVVEPRRLWGGLALWRVGVKQPPPKPLLQRGLTLG